MENPNKGKMLICARCPCLGDWKPNRDSNMAQQNKERKTFNSIDSNSNKNYIILCVCCHWILTQMLQMWMLLLLLKRNASKYYLRLLYFYFISLHGIWWRPANLFVLPCRTPSCPVMQRCSSVTHPVFFFADLIQPNRYSMAKRKQTNEVGGKNISRKCFMAIFFSWNTLRHMKPVYKPCMYRTRKCTHKAHHLFKNRIPNWRLLCYFILRKSLPAIDIGVSDWLLFFVNLIIYIYARMSVCCSVGAYVGAEDWANIQRQHSNILHGWYNFSIFFAPHQCQNGNGKLGSASVFVFVRRS